MLDSFYQIFALSFMYRYCITFFQCSMKIPSNIDGKSNLSGKTISFPHKWFISIDILSHSRALSASTFFKFRKILPSLTVKYFKLLTVLYISSDNILNFWLECTRQRNDN